MQQLLFRIDKILKYILVMNFIEDSEEQESKLFKKLESYFRTQGLTPFSSRIALAYFQKFITKMPHVSKYILDRINQKCISPPHEAQNLCPNIIPGLRAFPVWNNDDFPWIKEIESCFPAIKEEFSRLHGKQNNGDGIKFQPYRAPKSMSLPDCASSTTIEHDSYGDSATNTSGDWNVCYLELHNENISKDISKNNLSNVPVMSNILATVIPRDYHHSLISAIVPGTHILPHHGPTNKKLRCHVPLCVPTLQNADENEKLPPFVSLRSIDKEKLVDFNIRDETYTCLRVHDKIQYFEEGKCFIFDDSFEHEVFHPAWYPEGMPRVVLIIDIWHPDLTDEEVKFLDFVETHQLKNLARLTAESENNLYNTREDIGNTFYSVIRNAKTHAEVSDKLIWG